MIRVAISGSGKMGRQIRSALDSAAGFEAVGFVDGLAKAGECDGLTLLSDPDDLFDIRESDVVVDFSNAAWTPRLAEAAIKRGVRMVVGTTGLTQEFIDDLRARCAEQRLGAVVVSNFALGAVLMMHFARIAARHYDSAEIIELHHDQKVDAPSGTSLTTARLMAESRGQSFRRNVPEKQPLAGSRAADEAGITIHSVRLPGLVAHQEVIFGGTGETLTVRHDTTSRESFMPGILLALHRVMELDGLVNEMDELLEL